MAKKKKRKNVDTNALNTNDKPKRCEHKSLELDGEKFTRFYQFNTHHPDVVNNQIFQNQVGTYYTMPVID